MASGTERSRASRQRTKRGEMVVAVVVTGDLRDEMMEGGFLKQWDSEDRIAVGRAVEQVLAALVQRVAN